MSETTNEKNVPVFKVNAGSINGAVWEQKDEKGSFLSISMHRNYKDKDDKWQTTNTLRVNDLPTAVLVLEECFKFAKLKGYLEEQ